MKFYWWPIIGVSVLAVIGIVGWNLGWFSSSDSAEDTSPVHTVTLPNGHPGIIYSKNGKFYSVDQSVVFDQRKEVEISQADFNSILGKA